MHLKSKLLRSISVACMLILFIGIISNESLANTHQKPENTKAITNQNSQPQSKQTIPTRYDLRDYGYITSIKDQVFLNHTGSAFAATASIESASKMATDLTIDLSENHMITQCTNNQTYDYYLSPSAITYYLTSHIGPVTEAQDPYPNSFFPADMEKNDALTPSYTVKDVRNLNAFTYDMDLIINNIKLALMDNIAITSEMYYNINSGEYYDDTTFAYFYPKKYIYDDYNDPYHLIPIDVTEEPNHTITIIGWDDNYNTSNFQSHNTPTSPGAFIVKNSFGDDFGDDGIFYVSYEDGRIGTNAYQYGPLEKIGKTETLYHYDQAPQHQWLTSFTTHTITYGSVYQSKRDEFLKEVSAYFSHANTSVDIYIDTDLQTSGSAYDFTNLELVKSSTIDCTGYTTIVLDDSIELAKDNYFAIIIKVYDPSDEIHPFIPLSDSDCSINTNFYSYEGDFNLNDLYDYKPNSCLSVRALTTTEFEFDYDLDNDSHTTIKDVALYSDYFGATGNNIKKLDYNKDGILDLLDIVELSKRIIIRPIR